jgi:hypothetical protein
LREVIFGSSSAYHWYDDFQALGILPLLGLRRKTGVLFSGLLDGENRVFTLPEKYIHANGLSLDVYHNGRRLVETSLPDPRTGDFFCGESGGVGTGFDSIVLLRFAPSVRSILMADYQVAF